MVKPLVDKARAHEARLLRTLGASEKAALLKLLEKLTQGAGA
jgi:predicted lysophospholipase L1 biosynthesis ABC-type transport system permease subunit